MKPSHSLLRILLPLGIALSLAAVVADAAPRTVCFRLQIRDDRTRCPTPGTPGVKRACNPGDSTDFVGARVELWDRDSGDAANDEYIGTWVVTGPGVGCATFEWENASYAHGELHPDVYLRTRFEVRHTNGSGAIVRAVTATGQSRGVMTWRAYALPNCQGTCTFAGTHVPTTSTTSDTAVSFMILDAAQRVLQMYAPDMEGGTIKAWYPVVNNPNGTSCATGLAWSRTDFCLPAGGLGKEGDRTTHEMGHIVQMHLFHQDALRDVIMGGSWTMGTGSFETESGATTEGWAAYVGAVAWYDPNNCATTPFYGGVDLEAATLAQTTCSNNITVPRQVAKAFWDFDDCNNEAGTRPGVADDDRHSMTTGAIARRWEDFTDGTGNRADYESDQNGVNLRDYLAYVTTSNASETLLEHNCLTAQDDN
jgi:hypothetical protein